jgi:hypothetical protein
MKQAARREIQEKREAEKAAPKPVAAKKLSNVFSALCSDSDSETEVKVSKKKVSTQIPVAKLEQKQPEPQKSAAKKITREEEFPALMSTSKATNASAAASAPVKSNIKSIISKMCPGLEVAEKMAPVEKYYTPQAKIIHKKNEVQPEPACKSAVMVSDFVEAAVFQPKFQLRASEIDWAAMEYSDDSDEDW